MNYVRSLLVLGAIAVLAACQSMPSTTFDPTLRQTIRKVGIAPLGMPENAEVRILHSVGSNFGLIGAIVEESRAANARGELEDVLAKSGYDFKLEMTTNTQLAMTAAGFDVVQLPGARPTAHRAKFLKTVAAEAGVDAVLDVYVMSLGFFAAGATTDYRPGCHIAARLVDPKTQKVLFQDQVMYGAVMLTYQKAIVLPGDPAATFKDRDALQLDAPVTRDALKKALDSCVAELGKQFGSA
jgi:hypothetical protein